MKKNILLVGVMAFLIVSAGCGSRISDREASLNINGTEIKTSTSGSLPEGFPKDIPLFPKAEISNSSRLAIPGTDAEKCGSNKRQETLSVALISKDVAPSDVMKFYKTELPNAGWKLDTETQFDIEENDYVQLTTKAAKNDMELYVLVTQDKGSSPKLTTAMLMVQHCINK